MPGPHHMGIARAMVKRDQRGDVYQEILFGISQNYQDQGVPVFQFYVVRGGAYPHWFLCDNTWEPLHGGAYIRAPPSMQHYRLQLFYIYQTYQDFAQIYCHTPELDPPGVYAVFESTRYARDQAFYCTGKDTYYVGHRTTPEEELALTGQSKVLSMLPPARL